MTGQGKQGKTMNLLKMTFRLQPVILLLILLLPVDCLSADPVEEVNHLLQAVEDSQCDFVRNGKHHNSLNARKHLQKKYNYFKSRVKKAEDFIRYAATKSSMSGEKYMIVCDGHEVPSSEWLQAELDLFRRNNNGEVD
jgi:hypothetical protein